jgi:hypothetical protein
MIFSNKVQEYLKISGWTPARQIHIKNIKYVLSENYNVSEKIIQFLTSFYLLDIKFLSPLSEQMDRIHFDVDKVIKDFDYLWVQEDYKFRTNSNLCPIGQVFSDHMTLLMDEYGKVYGGYDDLLIYIAETGEEAIEAICTKKKFIEL